MDAMQFSHGVTSIDRFAPSKPGSNKATTLFLPYLLQTGKGAVKAFVTIYKP